MHKDDIEELIKRLIGKENVLDKENLDILVNKVIWAKKLHGMTFVYTALIEKRSKKNFISFF